MRPTEQKLSGTFPPFPQQANRHNGIKKQKNPMEPQSSSITEASGRNSSGSARWSILLLRRGGKYTCCVLGMASTPVNFHRMADEESCIDHTKTKPKIPTETLESRELTHLTRSISWAISPSCRRCSQQHRGDTLAKNRMIFKHFFGSCYKQHP